MLYSNTYQEVATTSIIFKLLMGRIVPFLLAGIGFLFICLGYKVHLARTTLEKSCTMSVTGTITRLAQEECGLSTDRRSKQYLYTPFIEYKVQGIPYEKSLNAHGYNYFSVGEKVTVNYNPSDPDQFYVKKDNAPKTIYRYYLPAGIFLLLLAFVEGIISNILISLI